MRFRHVLLLVLFAALALESHATSVVPPKFAELVNGADYVVRARVKSISYQTKERPGKPPLIYTNVALEVLETIAGTPPAQPVLRMLGGKTDGQELRVEGAPRFNVGDEDVLFVYGNGRTFCPLYAAMHGRYRVKKDETGREYMARNNDVPLLDVAEVAAAMAEGGTMELQKKAKSKAAALTPQSFADQIRRTRHAQ